MKVRSVVIGASVALSIALSIGAAISAQDKYTVKVPNGLRLSDSGDEHWQIVAVSQTDDRLKAMIANPTMIAAYKSGLPRNGKPFPNGPKIAKIEWRPKKSTEAHFPVRTPDVLQNAFPIETGSKKERMSFLEDLLFTHRGLSGPAVLQISSYWRPGAPLAIDFAPGADVADSLVEAKQRSRKRIANELAALVPSRLAEAWVGQDAALQRPINEAADRALAALADRITRWQITPSGSSAAFQVRCPAYRWAETAPPRAMHTATTQALLRFKCSERARQ